MIMARFYQTCGGQLWGFSVEGHAGYAGEDEDDIVCAAVSALSINTANALETLAGEETVCQEEDGVLVVELPRVRASLVSHDAELLMRALLQGLVSIRDTYGQDYVQVAVSQKP